MNKISCHTTNQAQAQSYASETSVRLYSNGQIVAKRPETDILDKWWTERAIARRELRNFAGKGQLRGRRGRKTSTTARQDRRESGA